MKLHMTALALLCAASVCAAAPHEPPCLEFRLQAVGRLGPPEGGTPNSSAERFMVPIHVRLLEVFSPHELGRADLPVRPATRPVQGFRARMASGQSLRMAIELAAGGALLVVILIGLSKKLNRLRLRLRLGTMSDTSFKSVISMAVRAGWKGHSTASIRLKRASASPATPGSRSAALRPRKLAF